MRQEWRGVYSFPNEESEGADPFVGIDEGEDKLEENDKAAGLTRSSHPRAVAIGAAGAAIAAPILAQRTAFSAAHARDASKRCGSLRVPSPSGVRPVHTVHARYFVQDQDVF